MWQLLLSILVPLVLHLGIEGVLKMFPNLPPWLVAILKKLEEAKVAAAELPHTERKEAITVARAKAAAQVHIQCKGASCPAELKH